MRLGVWLLLDPPIERADGVERVRALAAAAVVHPRHHEQPDRVLQLALGRRRVEDAAL